MALTNRAYSLFPCASCHRETAVKVSVKKKKNRFRGFVFDVQGAYVYVYTYRIGQYSRSQKCRRLKEVYSIFEKSSRGKFFSYVEYDTTDVIVL